VKDRARFESSVLHASVGLKYDTDGLEEKPGSAGLTLDNARRILTSNKPSASYIPIDDGTTVDMSSFRFGTLSSLVGHRARGAYLPLPQWAEKNSPSALREPIEAAKEQLAPNFSDPSQPNAIGRSGFYADDNEGGIGNGEESETSSSGSSSSSSSSSSSESGGQNADSESDSDSDDDSSSDDSDDNLLMPKVQPNGTAQNNLLLQPMGQQGAMSSLPRHQAHLSSQASSDDESSSSGDSDSSGSSDEDYNGDVSSANLLKSPEPSSGQRSRKESENVFGLMTPSGFAPIPEVSSSAKSSAMDDLKGLVIAPVNVEDSAATGPSTQERDSSAWVQLVRPELCGGLAVKARFLRGATKDKELQAKNINPSNPCLVCMEVHFSNMRPDSSSIRRIKVLPRSGSSGPFATKKILCPPEIPELKPGQASDSTIVLEFASMSNRDGDMIGRLEIKQGSAGSVPVEIKPSLGELLRQPQKTSVGEFDSIMHRMQGFQRIETSFTTAHDINAISQSILRESSLTVVGNSGVADKKLRFLGLLPASNDLVLVSVESNKSGAGKIVVCCDHAVAVNSISSLMRRSVPS